MSFGFADQYYGHLQPVRRISSSSFGEHLPLHTASGNRLHHDHQAPTAQEEFKTAEYERTVDHGKEKTKYIDGEIDVEADGYIKQKHKAFEWLKE
ncbi:hypothetical protein Ancab_035812 [Ancistrocladus abbreviatus]